MTRPTSRLACLCSLLLACTADPASDTGESESESESGSGSETSDEELGSCGEVTMSIIEDPSATPPGFDSNINTMLLVAEGNYAGTFVWSEVDPPFEVAHAGTQSPVTVSLSYMGGEIRLTEVELAGEFPDGVLGAPCANTVEIDVLLQLSTDDGLFAESMMIPLEISGFPGQGTGQPNIYRTIDFAAHMGSLAAADFGATEGEVSNILFGVNFTGEGAEGWVGMEVSDGLGLEGSVSFGMVATFTAPAAP